MPDPLYVLGALAAAALIAAAIMLVCGLPWRQPHPILVSGGWVISQGAAFYLGWYLLGGLVLDAWPKWPPTDNEGRFFYLLLPAVIGVELFGALGRACFGSPGLYGP